MAHAKRYLFENEEKSFSDACKVLGHPARRRIITLLRKHRHLKMDQLKDEIPLAESTISQHTNKLQAANLIQVKGNKKGESGFTLNLPAINALCELMRSFWEEGDL